MTAQAFETAVTPIRWIGGWEDGCVEMIDQKLLPNEETWFSYEDAQGVAGAIKEMVIRGAPAIGIAASYGVVLGMRELTRAGAEVSGAAIDELFDLLANTRPTAVNLFWALERMRALVDARGDQSREGFMQSLFDEAEFIRTDDRERCLTMGKFGAELMPEGARILTHCNTGGLATGGYGTALGVIRATNAAGKLAHVWIDETRPYLQGARLTAWECVKDELPSTLITDNMAGHFMQRGQVDAVVVGADRIGADGSTANKIGTYTLAVLCKHHGIPFYVAAPLSTIDLAITSGEDIPIEQRSAKEVTHVGNRVLAPEGVGVAHPAFDVTPGELIAGVITERGVARAPYTESLAALFDKE